MNEEPMDKNMRCGEHPEFDPFDRNQEPDSRCRTCCRMHNGARPAGDFSGEYTARESGIDNAKVKIGPMNLAQFGRIRYDLGWDYYFNDGPSWYVDCDRMTIYLDEKLRKERFKEIKEMGCPISAREWKEPTCLSANVSKHEDGVLAMSLAVGESKTRITLLLREGMTRSELRRKIDEFVSKLNKVKNDCVVESKI